MPKGMAYNDRAARRCCSPRADFTTHFVTLGLLVAIVTTIHSYTKIDDKSLFPKDGAIKGAC